MENEETTQDERSGRAVRQRGTISFPYADLNDAIAIVRAGWEAGGRRSQLDQLMARTEHASMQSGAFRNKVSAARLFGLITTKGMEVHIRPLGERMIDPEQEPQARRDAFLNVPLFKSLFDSYRGKLLPGSGALEREMEMMGVAPRQTERARQVFMRSAEQAGFLGQGRDRLIEPSFGPPLQDSATIVTPPSHQDEQYRHQEEKGLQGKPAVIDALFRMLPDEGQPFPNRKIWKEALDKNLDLAYEEGPPSASTSSEPSVPEQPSEQSENGAQGSES